MFGFLKKKGGAKGAAKKAGPAGPADPLAAYDGFIESLERQAAGVRKSAATLLALRGELARDQERYGGRIRDLDGRVATAREKGDARAERTLLRDREEARELLEQSEKALASANEDSALLLEVAEDLGRRVRELKTERQSARARMRVGAAVTKALSQQAEEFERVMALDAARDEVERAHALADVYREDQDKKGLPAAAAEGEGEG